MGHDIVTECKEALCGLLADEGLAETSEFAVVAGISGGADSVALLCALARLRAWLPHMEIVAVHVNHMIRGEEAERDAEFVRALCEKQKLAFVLCRADIPRLSKERKMTLEEAGRMERYAAFSRICGERNALCIMTAHHADDNLETILMNYFRGSGAAGLAGMRRYSPERRLLRPLLTFHKAELAAWLDEIGQDYVTDSTNLEEDAARNRLRSRIVPAITEYGFPNAAENILASAGLFREIDDYMRCEAARFIKEHSSWDSALNELALPAEALSALPPALSRYCIRAALGQVRDRKLHDVGAGHIAAVLELAKKQAGAQLYLPQGCRVRRDYDTLRFYQEHILPQAGGKAGWEMELTVLAYGAEECCGMQQNTCTAYVDYDKITDNLLLRTRQTGDMLTLYRDGGKKKLKDYLIDEKVPQNERDRLPLVVCGAHDVVWVVSKRLSEAYRVTEHTKRVLQIRIRKQLDTGETVLDKQREDNSNEEGRNQGIVKRGRG